MSCWWIVTVCCETLMFTLADIFEGQSCLFGWTSSGVWLPGLTSAFYQIEDFVSKNLSPPFYKPHRAGRTEWSLATFILLNSGCSCLSTMATFTFGTTRASSSSSRLRWETIFGLHFPLVGVRSSFSHFQVCDLPVRAAVFVPRKNWVVTGSDDMQVDNIFTSTFWLILTS